MLAVALTVLFAVASAMVVGVLVQSARNALALYGPVRDALAATTDVRTVRVLHAEVISKQVLAPAQRGSVAPLRSRARHRAPDLPLAA